MSVGRCRAVALTGLVGAVIEIEAQVCSGLPQFQLIGTQDASLKEARSRVVAAAASVGVDLNQRKFVVSLTPADLFKRGSSFDVGIAVSVLAALEVIDEGAADDVVHVGELGLDGRLRPVAGVLPVVHAAVRHGARRIIVPAANAPEAQLVPNIRVIGAADLADVVRYHGGSCNSPPSDPVPRYQAFTSSPGDGRAPGLDLADVLGQEDAKQALLVAAAGGHHLLLQGPPGAGKTMLASRLPGLLPELVDDFALEVSAVQSIAGRFDAGSGLTRQAPFEAPHHSASVASIVGGGAALPLPGAMSLAHRGVLFLDEAPEFNRGVIEALRQPLESGSVTIARSRGSVTYPARFQLVMALNPCPCGNFTGNGAHCSCSPQQRRSYAAKLSGPVLDRIDLRIEVPAARPREEADVGMTTAKAQAAVSAARSAQARRYAGGPQRLNVDLTGPELRLRFRPERGAAEALDRLLDRGLLTLRGRDRVLRVAWTLADLAGKPRPDAQEVSSALSMREPSLALATAS